MELSKICRICKIEKHIDCFSKNSRRHDKKENECRKCLSDILLEKKLNPGREKKPRPVSNWRKDDPSVEDFKDMIDYDSNTGILTWKKRPPNTSFMPGSVCGGLNQYGYMRVQIYKKSYMCHRIAWAIFYGVMPTLDIDHKNRIRSDNRIDNLRLVNDAQNALNKKKNNNNTSGYVGVVAVKDKWIAQITHMGKRHYLGIFSNKKEAAEKYMEVAKKLRGEYLNEELHDQ